MAPKSFIEKSVSSTVQRRTLLGGVGVALASSLGGCLSGSGGSATPTTRESPGTPNFEDSLQRTLIGTDGYPDTYPDYRETARLVGYDRADPDEVDVLLEPSARTIETGHTLGFRLNNPFEEELAMNDYDWQVHKWVDGDWYRVMPWVTPSPLTYLPAGETQHWTLMPTQEPTEAGMPVPSPEITTDVEAHGLGGGVYTFSVNGLGVRSEEYGGSTTVAAAFELDAEPLELTVSNNIEETTMEGDTLVARSARGDPESDDYLPAAYILRRVESPSTQPQPRITEQVVRNHQLRDGIALARTHDAREVRIEGYGENHPSKFRLDGTELYEYEGTVYEVTAEELDA